MCERLLQHGSSLGLYAEELDGETGRHLGNYPQAFTHLALINAVIHVISHEEAEADGAMRYRPATASVKAARGSVTPRPSRSASRARRGAGAS